MQSWGRTDHKSVQEANLLLTRLDSARSVAFVLGCGGSDITYTTQCRNSK